MVRFMSSNIPNILSNLKTKSTAKLLIRHISASRKVLSKVRLGINSTVLLQLVLTQLQNDGGIQRPTPPLSLLNTPDAAKVSN
jgi:hypothetical protein